MNLDRMIEGIESKLDNQSSHLKGNSLLYQAFVEVLIQQGGSGNSDDTLYARAAQRAKELDRESKEEESLELRQTPTDRIFGDALIRVLFQAIADHRERGFERLE